MNRTILIKGLFLASFLFAFLIDKTLAEAQDSSIHKQIRKITIASEPDYPPYCIIDDNGKAAGFAVELFLAAAKAVGIEANIRIGVWNHIKQELADGKIDALPFVGRTPERENLFDFTLPYLSLHGAIFVKKGTKSIKSLDDLKDKRIGVMKGDNAEEFVLRKKLSSKIVSTFTYEEAFRMLSSGEVDAVVTQRLMGLELIKSLNLKRIVPLDIQLPEFRQDFCFAVKKGNTELLSRLNEGLSVVIATKAYDELHLKWFGPHVKEKISWLDIATIAFYLFFPLVLIFGFLSIVFLRKEIKRRTQQLRDEIEDHKNTLTILNHQQLILNKMEQVAKIGGWEYDIVNQRKTWTRGVSDIFGIESNVSFDSFSESDIKYFHPDDWIKLKTAFENAIHSSTPYDLELRVIAKNGAEKWVRVSGQAELAGNKVVRIYESIMDITEKKLADDSLMNEKIRLKQILDNFPFGVYIVDKNYNIEMINLVLENEFGHPENLKCHEFIHNHPEPCNYCNHNKVMSGESCQWTWKSPKNNRIYELHDIPLKNQDGSISKIEVFHDITEQKHAEEELLNLKNCLEQKVEGKTKELKERIIELERFHTATIDREIRMKELKDEIKRLKNIK